MKLILVNIYLYTVTIFIYIFFFPVLPVIWVLTVPFDSKLVVLHQVTGFWGFLLFSVNPMWKLTVIGKEKINHKKVYIIISNHQSFVDILTLFQIQAHFKWVSKRENFKAPILGWTMRMNRYIELERNNPKSVPHMMETCRRNIQKGISIMIFPEGTRSRDGALLPFKEGAFRIAIENKIPILPVILDGSSKAVHTKGLMIKEKQNIIIKILDEIPYDSFPSYNPGELKAHIRQMYLDELSKLR